MGKIFVLEKRLLGGSYLDARGHGSCMQFLWSSHPGETHSGDKSARPYVGSKFPDGSEHAQANK